MARGLEVARRTVEADPAFAQGDPAP
jgi:hypothetical protein